MLHNFGGTLGMHGSIRIVNTEIPRAANELANSSMVGVGITPEGIFQNYVVYQFALEKAWNYKEINHKKWIKFYATTRYGMSEDDAATPVAGHAWLNLLKSVYAYEGIVSIHGKYVYCRRPTLRYTPSLWYDVKFVKKALGKFLTIAGAERNNLFMRDLVDLTRQLLQIQAEAIYTKIVESFKKRDVKKFSVVSKLFLDLLHDLDALLATHDDFLLGKFLEASKALARATNDSVEQYEFNARNQITLWGPNGQIVDYATKQWNGIVMDYYLPRWSLFLQQLRVSLETKTPFNQSKFQQDVFNQVELPFNQNTKEYPTVASGTTNTFDVIKFN
jgi:alpha-N-acetylglucosaminidase